MTGFPRLFLLILLALVLGGSTQFSTAATPAADVFDAANQAYETGDFARAADLYEQIISLHGPSANVFYNLGNAYYRQGNAGQALLNYERARVLNPRDNDVTFNRKFLINEAGAQLPDPGRFDLLMNRVTLNEALIGTAIIGWAALFLFLIGGLRTWKRRPFGFAWFIGGLACLMLAVLGVITVYYLMNSRYHPGFAVVTAPTGTHALAQPTATSDPVQQFAPGSQIYISATRGNWHYLRLPESKSGWVSVDAVEHVVPRRLRVGTTGAE